MNVMHVLWSGRVGGIERVVYDLACSQIRHGHHVVLLMGQGEGIFYEKAVRAGIPVVSLNMHSGFSLNPALIWKALKAMRDVSIVHYHGFMPLAALAGIFARRPIVFSDHGHDVSPRAVSLAHKIKNQMRNAFVRYAVSAITANSEFTRRHGSHVFGIPASRIVVVHNGIDAASIRTARPQAEIRSALSIPANAFVVGTVCRLAQFKRVDRLIEGFARMRCGTPAFLLIVGDGPLMSALRDQVARLHLDDTVLFTGSRADVAEMLSAMSVFVVSSQNEPFGLAGLEALATGLPVVTFSDAGGLIEVLGDAAWCVADTAELGRTLERICLQQSTAPREAIDLEHFHIDAMTQSLAHIYEGMNA